MKYDRSNIIAGYGEYEERKRVLWYHLSTIHAISAKGMHSLHDFFGEGIEEMFSASAETLSSLDGIGIKSAEKILASAKNLSFAAREFLRLSEKGIYMLTFYDGAFPDRIRLIPDPPFLLFVKGTLPRTDEPACAVIGSRQGTSYGIDATEIISGELASKGCHIISGLAYGIDAAAHKGALRACGKTTAVMGCGIDECYPIKNYSIYEQILETGGAVISEYPPKTPALPANFPARNRIISGLSDCVLVMEARKKSGTKITVSYALEQGKDVFALPGRLSDTLSEGCLELLDEGAQLLTGSERVMDFLETKGFSLKRMSEKTSRAPGLPKEDIKVYRLLSNEPVTIDDIRTVCKMPFSDLFQALVRLEILGYSARTPDGRYVRRGKLMVNRAFSEKSCE